MKVAVWGINYVPEVTGIAPFNAALCEYLVSQGHEVRMVTSFAYYPAWKKQAEDKSRVYRKDLMNGVEVHRCWHYVPCKVSALKRILHEASFVLTSFLCLLLLPRPQVMVVVSPPLLLGAAAWILGRIKRAPFVFHVQDLQPDAALGMGMLKGRMLTDALYGLEAIAYQRAARVSGISPGMMDVFAQKGVPEAKRVLFPNGVTIPPSDTLPRRGAFRARYQMASTEFLAVYSGNMGVKQGLSVLVEAAKHLAASGITILLCGDGAARAALEEAIAARGLRSIRMLPLLPAEEYAEMLLDADVSLITQQSGSGRFFFPSKLLSILAHGRPVLTVADADSDLAVAVAAGAFGLNVPPGAPEKVAAALVSLRQDAERLHAMEACAVQYIRQFEMHTVLQRFEAVLQELA